MILADTSVWVDHIHSTNPAMLDLLRNNQLVTHPFVIGELALGNLPKRPQFLEDLRDLRSVALADWDEVMTLIEEARISGKGLGWVDVHLLASSIFTPSIRLWTRDKRLKAVAASFGRAAHFEH